MLVYPSGKKHPLYDGLTIRVIYTALSTIFFPR